MVERIEEIKAEADARKISEELLRSLHQGSPLANPFKGKLFQHEDGTIVFMGIEIQPEEASERMSRLIWKHRTQFNRQIKRWNKTGGQVLDCGC